MEAVICQIYRYIHNRNGGVLQRYLQNARQDGFNLLIPCDFLVDTEDIYTAHILDHQYRVC